MRTIDLNGAWRLDGRGPAGEEPICIDGLVPGHVHLDLIREGKIPDPFWRDNSRACQWVEHWEWGYAREFDVPENADLSWAELEFEGLDTFATITLNGREIARTATMFVPHRFDVSAHLRPGRNRLAVRFDPVGKRVEGKRMDFPCAFDTPERMHTRRIQCTFGWDWVDRFVSYGIWRPVRLLLPDGARFTDCHVCTKNIDDGGALLGVSFTVDHRAQAPYRVLAAIRDPDGAAVWSREFDTRQGETVAEITVESPRLWWPAGYGEQPLYRCRFDLMDEHGNRIDSREFDIGIRTVEIASEEDRPGSEEWRRTMEIRAIHPESDARNGDVPGRSFQVRVNGQPIFCKGGNWVPADPWPSRITPEWYERLLSLAARGHVNCLRVWGGGIYEPEPFWNACDRLGILICQDFMMACGVYPEDDPEFLDLIRYETPLAIRRLRNHPSLGWWSGDNENCMNDDEANTAAPGRFIAAEITGPACKELDPYRPFLPTSPFGGRPNNCMTIGDVHFSPIAFSPEVDAIDYRQRVVDAIGRFNSECAIGGAPERSTLARYMDADDLLTIPNSIWYHHTSDSPYQPMRILDALKMMADTLFGQAIGVDVAIDRLQYVGYEFARLILEAARRQKWYNAGVLFWMFNDCWPATDWSIVDYYGTPKAPLYAMMHSARPVMGCIEDAGDCYRFWICNDTLAPVSGQATIRVQPWQGPPSFSTKASVNARANSSTVALELPKADLRELDVESVLVFDLASSPGPDRSWLYPEIPSLMAPPPVLLRCQPYAGGVVVSGSSYARVVILQGDCDFSDNYFELLPGEEKRVAIQPVSYSADTLITARCWNLQGPPQRAILTWPNGPCKNISVEK